MFFCHLEPPQKAVWLCVCLPFALVPRWCGCISGFVKKDPVRGWEKTAHHLERFFGFMLNISPLHCFSREISDESSKYGWWKKAYTSWNGESTIIYRVLYMSSGAGFLPSTIWWCFCLLPNCWSFKNCDESKWLVSVSRLVANHNWRKLKQKMPFQLNIHEAAIFLQILWVELLWLNFFVPTLFFV